MRSICIATSLRNSAAERQTPNADTPIRRHAHTPTRRHADTPTRRHADTPTRFSTPALLPFEVFHEFLTGEFDRANRNIFDFFPGPCQVTAQRNAGLLYESVQEEAAKQRERRARRQ